MIKRLFLQILTVLLILGPSWHDQVGAMLSDRSLGRQILEKVKIIEDRPLIEPIKVEPDYDFMIDESLAMRVEVPVLMFHYIEDISSDTSDQIRYKLSYSPANLERLLINLRDQGIETLTFWDVKDIAQGRRAAPDKGVILTFDDGYNDQYTDAFRLLQQYGMKGVFYIIANKPDNDGEYANWAQIKEMAEAGMEIGSHTVNHLNLAGLGDQQLEQELIDSRNIISEKIGRPVISLCYPSGKYNDGVAQKASLYYLFARTTEAGSGISMQNRYKISTVRIMPTTDPNIVSYYY